MQSSASKLKKELSKNRSILKSHRLELSLGLACFAREFSATKIQLVTTEQAVANLYTQALFGLVDMKSGFTTQKIGKNIITSLENVSDRISLINLFSMLGVDDKISQLSGNSLNAFFVGAFLVCGRLANPETSYSLEFSPYDTTKISLLHSALLKANVKIHKSTRRGKEFLYTHDSESIEIFLTLIGSSEIALDIMGSKILKERRNTANRLSNCDTANIAKTIAASNAQMTAIKKLLKKFPKEEIPAPLYQLAVLRMENPELSLSELGSKLTPPLSRSGVNHRMKKILEFSSTTKK